MTAMTAAARRPLADWRCDQCGALLSRYWIEPGAARLRQVRHERRCKCGHLNVWDSSSADPNRGRVYERDMPAR